MRAPALVLLGATALAAAACSEPQAPPVSAANPLADSAEQIMYGVRSNLTSQGVIKGKLLSDSAFFLDEGTRLELFDVNTTFFTATGAPNGVLTSRRGTYFQRSEDMEAREDVVVVGSDGKRLTTPQLRYSSATDQISSDSAFVLTTPAGERLTGIGFTSDPNLQVVRITRATSGTGANVTLPEG